MSDYISAFNNPAHPYHRDAVRIHDTFADQSTIVDGVARWLSNNNVPPADIIAFAATFTPEINVDACDAARDAELNDFLSAYRKNRETNGYSPEEKAEIRNHIGENAIDAITGKRIF